jgi:hypothetical protein
MTETQINLRRQPLQSARRHSSDQFRYAGVMVAVAAIAALSLVLFLRDAPADPANSAVAAELPQPQ